jgi:proteasome beta subunit
MPQSLSDVVKRTGEAVPVTCPTAMSMPFFTPGDDPGTSFPNLLRRMGHEPFIASGSDHDLGVPHATTCVAVRYADGVLMAGDRRATSGNLISHRSMEKVAQADRHSAVAIAGAAGPAMEMVKLFQLQLEHYEKVEGQALSLEGKANQLSMLVRGNLPAAMQGMVVVPIFAGYDLRRSSGRLFTYDVTGGRYEETEYIATGSGSLHAGTVIKVGYSPGMTRADAVNLVLKALWEAADADSATGGPDALRGIYPVVATVTSDGFIRLDDDELRQRYEVIAAEQLRRLRPTTEKGVAS